jgi:hypothetical protein
MNLLVSSVVAYILGVISNYSYGWLIIKFKKGKKDELFKILDDVDGWESSDGEVFFYIDNPDYKIKINEGRDLLSERFKKFPDRDHDRISWVEVKYKEAVFFGWNFMHLDGFRYLVPVPRTQEKSDKSFYDYYDISNIEVKVFKIIGQSILTIEPNKIEGLKSIARILGIVITEL